MGAIISRLHDWQSSWKTPYSRSSSIRYGEATRIRGIFIIRTIVYLLTHAAFFSLPRFLIFCSSMLDWALKRENYISTENLSSCSDSKILNIKLEKVIEIIMSLKLEHNSWDWIMSNQLRHFTQQAGHHKCSHTRTLAREHPHTHSLSCLSTRV